MKNQISINKENIFTQQLKTAANPSEAWQLGEHIFMAAEAGLYKDVGREAIIGFLLSAAAMQKENGLVPLYEDKEMPGDARVDIIFKPSYALAAAAIYAFMKWPEEFSGELKAFFKDLLEGGFRYGIAGHGYEAPETERRTLLMLCKAGARGFIQTYGKDYPVFSALISLRMAEMEAICERIDKEGIVYVRDGFSNESVNHLIKELVAIWNDKPYPVFVYGTLMKGCSAGHMMDDCSYAGRFLLKDYAPYDLGAYPGIVPCAGESVLGELYFVDKYTLAEMDKYECLGILYDRVSVNLGIGDNSFTAEAYVYKRDVGGRKLMREPWDAKNEDLVWYAAYGSNLSQERFDCYIKGGTCKENGKHYTGAADPTPARECRLKSYPGKLYFGNTSCSWDGCGVAFYDPEARDESDRVHMKLYKISRGQLHDVISQEGCSATWYGRLICLEMDDRGVPVYTITSETLRPRNAPAQPYEDLIKSVLCTEFGLHECQAEGYINKGK